MSIYSNEPDAGLASSNLVAIHFNHALALHRAGDLVKAKTQYQQVLALAPSHIDALHLLGVLLEQVGDFEQGVALVRQSLDLHPANHAAHNNLGKMLNDHAQPQAALNCFERAIALSPGLSNYYCNLANVQHRLQQYTQALANFDQALLLEPQSGQALQGRANALSALDLDEAALQNFSQMIAVQPSATAYRNRGLALIKLGQWQAALQDFDQSLELDPDNPEACFDRGNALHLLGQNKAAIQSYDQAIALQPTLASCWFNRANVLLACKRNKAALASYDQALALQPDNASIHCGRGSALQALGHFDEALPAYRLAADLDPESDLIACRLGIMLRLLGQFDEALSCYDHAIALNCECSLAYLNRGNVLHDLGNTDAAIQSYLHAIELAPDEPLAHFGLSLCYLSTANFSQGWLLYEWRLKHPDFKLTLTASAPKRWSGSEDLRGASILIHAEQGIGDVLQFVRYAKLLAARGARVVLEVPASLLLLLARVEGVAQTILQGTPLPQVDYYCPIMSLPLAFGTDLASIPVPQAYIVPDPEKVKAWQARLGAKTRPRIGIAWSGQELHKNDRQRSMALSAFLALLPKGCQYISLQNNVRDSDVVTLHAHPELLHFGSDLTDFTDTAALCELVDIVVTVDTAAAHLAGGMGKPVWVFLPFNADWRWLKERDDTPWYPAMRLVRRQRGGDSVAWREALQFDLNQVIARVHV